MTISAPHDNEGVELPSAEAAIAHAELEARQLAAEEVRGGRLVLDHRIDVAGTQGKVIATVMFRDAVRLEG